MLIDKIQKALDAKGTVERINQTSDSLTGTEGFKRDVLCRVTIYEVTAIQALLHLANELSDDTKLKFSIYPVSTGNNWGYGSSIPSTVFGNIVLLDLSQLNAIPFFDAENGVVSIQPGVTQQQLFDYLQERQSDFMVPVTGAGPTCSILSNALERGYGITPIADHFTAVTAVNGYLPNGDFYTSSLDVMFNTNRAKKRETCLVDKTFKWKHGPYLDGIFTQSGNMIVTEITLVLARPKPGFDSFYMRFYKSDSFNQAYATVKQIFSELDGIVGSINLMDKRRVVAMVSENPNGASAHNVMSLDQIETLAKQNDVPEWTIVGTIYGSKKVASAARKDIKRIAKGNVDQLLFSSSPLIKLGKLVTSLFSWSVLDGPRLQLEKLSAGIDIMKGKPNQVALPLAYWRNPRVKPSQNKTLNPAADGCGLLWYAPLIPANTAHMQQFIEMIRAITPKYNIEPMITFTNLTGYSTDSTIPIVFDLENPEAVDDAHACLKELLAVGLEKGFVPYRLNIEQQQNLNSDAPFWKTATAISKALDPNGVVSPNRYNPTTS